MPPTHCVSRLLRLTLQPAKQITMKATIGIQPETQRMANGWAAVLAFPNGGRQLFSSRHGTMDDALEEARHSLKVRIEYEGFTVPDPQPNCLQVLEEIGSRCHE